MCSSDLGLLNLYTWTLQKHRKFAYDGYKLVAEFDAMNNDALLANYLWQPVGLDVPLRATIDGNASYFVADGNKNIIALKDATGATTDDYTYTPFGAVTASGSTDNPFRFSSEYHDTETGLVYYNYRYYSPVLGRWTKQDPVEEEGGVNLYVFIENKSVNSFDVFGLWSEIENENDPSYGRRIYVRSSADDTKESLAKELRLDPAEFEKWAIVLEAQKGKPCKVSVPNTVYVLDLIWYPVWNSWQLGEERVIRNAGYKVVEINDPNSTIAKNIFSAEDIFGIVVMAHGDPDYKGSFLASDDRRVNAQSINLKYKLGALKLIVCYAKNEQDKWRKAVAPNGYFYPGKLGRIYSAEASWIPHGI